MTYETSCFDLQLARDIKHHNRMRTVNCTAYIGLTVAFIAFGGAAAVLASGGGLGQIAGALAAAGTAAGALERASGPYESIAITFGGAGHRTGH